MAEPENLVAESVYLVADDDDDAEIIKQALGQPSGSQEKYRRQWIEFHCDKGVHYGKWSRYEGKKRTRIAGGYLGRLDKVKASGRYGEQRVYEFIANHDCHYPERFYKDMDECGVSRIEVEGWPSGSGVSGLSGSGRHSGHKSS